jgi:MoxR-like ATPase
MREEIKKIRDWMEGAEYVTDPAMATSVHLAMTLRKPLLIEGHAGVGKTEVAKVMARVLGTRLIRLQCYEGLDAAQALYEWNYPKQILHIKLQERSDASTPEKSTSLPSPFSSAARCGPSRPGAPPVPSSTESTVLTRSSKPSCKCFQTSGDDPEIGTITADAPT